MVITNEMIEAGMDAAKAERWIFCTDVGLRGVILKILQAAFKSSFRGMESNWEGETMRDKEEVEDMARETAKAADDPKAHAMTYEEGLRDALDWVLGGDDPFGDD